ncbi:GtrA family protein [Pantoea sp. GD03673]|uniref:GtrA family protein n=1 Tax=Pantoea sp. GD03673 TaxID=2975364 RepID=UPI00244A67A4|nr:GtrA family protein [Pantoea sp. GD03673]MDH2065990.1 GtrA family protein [Pantoea sp. GD03673]
MLTFFAKYMTVGMVNTLIHWLTFFIGLSLGLLQSTANLIAFCIAVTFSFFVNARWTFRQRATTWRYILYAVFMGAMAFSVGFLADRFGLYPIITLIASSAISLVCGFLFSRFVVFKGE